MKKDFAKQQIFYSPITRLIEPVPWDPFDLSGRK